MKSSRVWLATVGLGRGFGGVAHVARTTLTAFSGEGSPFRVERILSLFDPRREPPPVALPAGARWKSFGRGRASFLLQVMTQAVSRPDLIVYDHVDLAQCQGQLPRSLRAPYAVWVHGIEVWKPLPRRKLEALRSADVLLLNSAFTKERFESIHGPFPRAVVVPLTDGAVPLNHSVTAPREPWILTVGRMEPDRPKGHREILEVLPRLIREVPGLHWHVAGTGSGFAAFQAAVEHSGCQEHITLHGFAAPEVLAALFRRSRVFCMPSEGEGFGVVYLEAMGQGCIPVGSVMDAAREVIGGGGECVDHTDPGSLGDCLARLLHLSPEEAARRADLAVQRADHFNPEIFSRNLFAALGSR